MTIDAENISKKSSGVAVILALTFGTLGLHRFYVGKWKSGIILFLFGSVYPAIKIAAKLMELFGYHDAITVAGYIYILSLLAGAVVLYDLFAIYSQSFTDVKGKLVISGSEKDEYVGRSVDEIFLDRLNVISSLLIFAIFIIIVYVLPV